MHIYKREGIIIARKYFFSLKYYFICLYSLSKAFSASSLLKAILCQSMISILKVRFGITLWLIGEKIFSNLPIQTVSVKKLLNSILQPWSALGPLPENIKTDLLRSAPRLAITHRKMLNHTNPSSIAQFLWQGKLH